MQEISLVRRRLMEHRDDAYGQFQRTLIPNIPPQTVIGVRVPIIRRLAKEIGDSFEAKRFLSDLPHTYHEENYLHTLLLNRLHDYATCLKSVETFLPYVDNWAVCDALRPPIFAQNLSDLHEHIAVWIASDHPYTVRFGIKMLMDFYLEGAFQPEQAALVIGIHTEEYYVKMMIAWYFATALAKQWEAVVPYLEQHRMEKWVHRKTIQKAVESYRITDEQKRYLRTLKG